MDVFAGPGYDLVTGIGTPIANQLVPDLAALNTVLPAAPSFTATAVSSTQINLAWTPCGRRDRLPGR